MARRTTPRDLFARPPQDSAAAPAGAPVLVTQDRPAAAPAGARPLPLPALAAVEAARTGDVIRWRLLRAARAAARQEPAPEPPGAGPLS